MNEVICFQHLQASFLTEEADQPSPPPSSVSKDSSSELKEAEAILNEAVVDERLPVHDSAEIRASIVRLVAVLRSIDSKRSVFDKVRQKYGFMFLQIGRYLVIWAILGPWANYYHEK